jgi:PTH1 family peptidyl-tRNA hydrolase
VATEHAAEAGMRVVIGLGNPGTRYLGTPHNVGYDILDRICARLSGTWVRDGDALVARVPHNAEQICLVKLDTHMNSSGAALESLRDRFDIRAVDSIVVHDDADLPLGVVRVRMRGSAGGHRGVASVLDVFQTDAVPRVKVGVGRPLNGKNIADYVLEPFSADARPVVDDGCRTAVDRVLALLESRPPKT